MKHAALAILCISLFATGCRTLTNPFGSMGPDYTQVPVEELRQAATTIESSISRGIRDFEPSAVSVRLDSPEVLQAIRTRAARHEMVDEFLSTGHSYEQRNGLLTVLRTSEYKRFGTSRDRDRYALLVMGENGDRWALYEGIVKLNNYPSRSLSAVQQIFHEARVAQLKPGQKYQNEQGEVVLR
jgi:hypothetical protein